MGKIRSSRKHEREVAKELGGKRIAGSGCSPYAKGDVRAPGFLVEAKETKKASLSVKAAWLDKIWREAMARGEEPALAVRMQTEQAPKDWIVIPLAVFNELRAK